MSKLPEIKSDFALLDVIGDTATLASIVEKSLSTGSGRVRVRLEGEFVDVWSDHDGVSQEFEIGVLKVEIEETEQK